MLTFLIDHWDIFCELIRTPSFAKVLGIFVMTFMLFGAYVYDRRLSLGTGIASILFFLFSQEVMRYLFLESLGYNVNTLSGTLAIIIGTSLITAFIFGGLLTAYISNGYHSRIEGLRELENEMANGRGGEELDEKVKVIVAEISGPVSKQ